jgi:DNA-binding MarR family transcriptional regulator
LRNSEWTTLREVGTFRVVSESDLVRDVGDPDVLRNDVRHLVDEGLLERKTAVVNEQPTRLLVLTPEGKALLEDARRDSGEERPQQYHSGLVKPRELAHDVQIYRAFQAERQRIEADGGHVQRVSLDYELKRDYQTFLNRPDKPQGSTFEGDMEAFADSHNLTIIDGHLELPDLRIEYEDLDGRIETRDVEVVTEHYSRAQLAGKARAGFSLYRSAPMGIGRTGGSRSGGTKMDPHNLEWLR